MTVLDAIYTIRDVLGRERAWRERVFTGAQQRGKLADIDHALASLTRLEDTLRRRCPDLFPEQLTLPGS